MRELILLRHAHAEAASTGQADLDRPLSPIGLAEAEAAGRWLKENNLLPDCVLCSPARRTRETLEAVLGITGFVEKRLEDAVYDATPGTLMGLIEARGDVDRLLVVGHNPGWNSWWRCSVKAPAAITAACRRAASRCCRWTARPASSPAWPP